MRVAELHRPLGTAGDENDPVVVTPESAGWAHCGLRVVTLAPGETRSFETGDDEVAVLPPVSGGAS